MRMAAKLQFAARLAVPFLALIIAFLSLKPADPNQTGGFPALEFIAELLLGSAERQDKVGHFLAYAALAGAAAFGFRARPRLVIFGMCLAYGGLFELLQASLPGRYASFADMFANGSGAAMGILSAFVLSHFLKGIQP